MRFFDWFAGIGGFRLGLEAAGMVGIAVTVGQNLEDPARKGEP